MERIHEGKKETAGVPEIVAPAGNIDAFKAAISAGADAIYLGLKEFNARRRAENFDISELPYLVKEAHLRQVKIYVTLNIVLKNTELLQAFNLAEKIFDAGADAIILQDLGFAQMLKKSFKDARIHASTQINAHNISTVQLLKDIGFKRVVLSRELSVGEIERIVRETGLETEVFVHGALCYSYSGQCLFSSIVGKRSGNRGLCAQPCRLPYRLLAESKEEVVEADLPFDYLLSTKDLFGLTNLYRLIKAGVSALKIEGRLKSEEYVSLVTEVYARELKRAVELKEKYVPLKESIDALEEAFSRGFSPAYLEGIRGNQMMSYNRPNNRGVFVGRVVYVDEIGGRVGVALRKDVSKGDVLEFWTSKKGKVTQKVKKLFNDKGEAEEVKAGERAHILVEKDRHLIKPGDRVYRVVNEKILKEIREKLRNLSEKLYPLSLKVRIEDSGKAQVIAEVPGVTVEFEEVIKVEEAKSVATTEREISLQLSKLGGTPYYLERAEVHIPKGVHLKVKEINKIRRRAVEEINKKILASVEKKPEKVLDASFWEKVLQRKVKKSRFTPIFAVKVGDKETFKLALEAKPDILFVRYPFFRNSGLSSFEDFLKLLGEARAQGVEFGIAFPEVLKDSELENAVLALSELKEEGVFVLSDNLGLIREALKIGVKVIADYHLNITNSLSVNYLNELGVRYVTLSQELSYREMVNTLENSSGNQAVLIAGDIEIMVAEHCPLTVLSHSTSIKFNEEKGVKPCVLLAREKTIAPRFCELSTYRLLDRKGFEFPIRTDTLCRGYIYNSRFLCAVAYLGELYKSGVNFFRVDILTRDLSKNEILRLLFGLRAAVDLIKKGKDVRIKEDICPNGFTKGHFERGVL